MLDAHTRIIIIIHFQSYNENLFIIKIDYFLNYNDIFPHLKEKNGCSVLFIEMTGFPDSSVGKESTCNAGDPDLIPGSGRSAGEGIG